METGARVPLQTKAAESAAAGVYILLVARGSRGSDRLRQYRMHEAHPMEVTRRLPLSENGRKKKRGGATEHTSTECVWAGGLKWMFELSQMFKICIKNGKKTKFPH